MFDTDCVCLASSCHGTACHPRTPPPLLPDRGCPRSPGLLHRPRSSAAGDPAPCLDCRVRGPSHTPSPAQGWPRNARRTSSGAGTSAASPLCGDATRTTTARTTATRTTAVSGRWGRAGRRGTPYLARTWLSCRPATCVDLTPAAGQPLGTASLGAVGLSDRAGSWAAGGPYWGRGGARGAVALEEGTPHPVAEPELWAKTRPSLRGSSFLRTGRPPGLQPRLHGTRGFFKVSHGSRPSRAPLLPRFFFVNEWAPQGP